MSLKLANRILSKDEIHAVVAWHRKSRRRRYLQTHQRLIVFRLACCCGLRRCEISGLELRDLFVKSEKPFLRIRKEITKGHRQKNSSEVIRKERRVSLSVDRETLEDLKRWLKIRQEQSGGDLYAPFISGQGQGAMGKRRSGSAIAEMWKTAVRLALGDERARCVSVHGGRHTYCSTLVSAGLPLGFVRDNAGHANIATTNTYVHHYEMNGIQSVFGG